MHTLYLTILAVIAGFGFLFFRKLSLPFKYLTIYVLAVFISENINIYLVDTIGTNFPGMYVFSFVGVLFNGLIYYHILKEGRRNRKIILFTTIIAAVLLTSHLGYTRELYDFPSINLIINAFQIVIFVFLTYVKLLNDPRKSAIYTQPLFWLNSGNFFFYVMTFFVFAFFNYVYKIGNGMWVYQLLQYANFVMYTFFFIAIFLNSREANE